MNPINNNPMNSMQPGMSIQPHVMHGGINQHHMGVIAPQGMIPTHMVNIQQIQSQQQIPAQQLQQQQLQQQQLQQQQQQIQQQLTPQQQLQKQQISSQQQIIPSQQQQQLISQQQLSNQQQLTPQQHIQLQQQQVPIPAQQQLLQQQQQQQQENMNSPHKPAPAEPVTLDQIDPVSRAKLLLPSMKEAYKKLMADSASVFNENILADSGNGAFEPPSGNPEATFGTFNEILDLMECNLRLALDTLVVNKESSKYAPSSVQVYSKDPSTPDSITYPQYLALCKSQVAFHADVKDILTRGIKTIAERSSLPQHGDQ